MEKTTLKSYAEIFHSLHAGPDVLVLANVWDVASARTVEELGLPALATSSAGIAFSLGYPDGQHISREEMLAAVRRITSAVKLPVTADLEAGYGLRPEEVAETVRQAIEAGAIGGNLEDSAAHAMDPLLDASLAVERIRAAREAANASGLRFFINARTDSFLLGMDPKHAMTESIRRANAYQNAGADGAFVPGVSDPATIERLAAKIAAPLNVLCGPRTPSIGRLRDLGVRRVSVGSGLMRAAIGFVRRAVGELKDSGTYTGLDGAPSHAEMNRVLGLTG